MWTAIATLAVVPFYIRYLGIEAYGMIGFFITLQGIFLLLDLGLSPTVSREIAKYGVEENGHKAANFLHSIAVVYWLLAASIVVFFLLFANVIAAHWLHASSAALHGDMLVLLMGVSIACRFPHSIYRGVLIGTEKLVVLNGINVLMVTVSTVGAVLVLSTIQASLEVFLIWQSICGVALTYLMRTAAWKCTPQGHNAVQSKPVLDVGILIKIWPFAAGMAMVSVASVVLLQLDKLVLSALVPLEQFGIYMVAVLASSAIGAVFMPVFNIIYPRMTYLAEAGETATLNVYYTRGTKLLGMALFPLAMVVGIFSEPFITLWTGDAQLATQVKPLILCLVAGFAINGIMHFPYALQLAYGRSAIALRLSVVAAIVSIPILLFLVTHYGVLGGAISWLVVQIIYLFAGCWLTHRSILVDTGWLWLLRDVGTPLAASLLVGLIVSYSVTIGPNDALLALYWSGASGLTAFLLALSASPEIFPSLRNFFSSGNKH